MRAENNFSQQLIMSSSTIIGLSRHCWAKVVHVLTSGGATLYIESTLKRPLETTTEKPGSPGSGSMELTGQLGDVMKESAHIAYTYAKSHLMKEEAHNDFLQNAHIHVHVPEVRYIMHLIFFPRTPVLLIMTIFFNGKQ